MESNIKKNDIKNLTKNKLAAWLQDRSIRPFRAGQIFKWIYLRKADSFEVMTDLSKEIRHLLESNFTIDRLPIANIETSHDGTQKYLFRLYDGKFIESVLIPVKNHYTLCISTQVGCAQGCKFCLTAKGGFIRNLFPGEIIAQVREIRHGLDNPDILKNIVLMGMGEPLANYNNLIDSLDILTDSDDGLKFSTRRVTISTAGLIPKFSDLGRSTSVNLAISLNATDNKTRNMLMPINRTYPIEKLMDACMKYPLPKRRKITFEYILIKNVNDSVRQAKELVALLSPIKAKINLIPFNEHPGVDLKRPSDEVINKFLTILLDSGYTAIIRRSRGQDISAACGQLSANAK